MWASDWALLRKPAETSGGHDPQHVKVGQNAVDKSLLPGAEGVMAKVTAKGF